MNQKELVLIVFGTVLLTLCLPRSENSDVLVEVVSLRLVDSPCYVSDVATCGGTDSANEEVCADSCEYFQFFEGVPEWGYFECDGNGERVVNTTFDTATNSSSSTMNGLDSRSDSEEIFCSVVYDCHCPGAFFVGPEEGVSCVARDNGNPSRSSRTPEVPSGDTCSPGTL